MLSHPACYSSCGNVFQPYPCEACPNSLRENMQLCQQTQARIAAVEDEDVWAANPWQAQVDAHIFQLQQAGAAFPVLGSSDHIQSAGASVSSSVQADLFKRNTELEGTIALLEENLMKKDRELTEATRLRLCSALGDGTSSIGQESSTNARSCREEAVGTKDLMAEVLDLRRRNEFLSTVVARFEGKTMTLEKEIVALTLEKEEAGQLHRVNELEGQVALLEDVVARKDGELEDLYKHLSSEKAERKKRETQTKLDALAREDTSKLKEEIEFLSNVIRRFEQKTMDMETQLEVLLKTKDECIANEKKLAVCREELDVARAVAADHKAKENAERAVCRELQKAQSDIEERLEQEQQAAEGAALALREYKKDHNQKMQELLKKTQLLEKQKRDVEVELIAAKEALVAADKLAQLNIGSEELDELRLLNKQMVERLGKERTEHAQSKQSLTIALEALDNEKADHAQTKLSSSEVSRENESLSIRLEYLVGQLYELATRNDELQAVVLAMEEERKKLDFDADLHLMS